MDTNLNLAFTVVKLRTTSKLIQGERVDEGEVIARFRSVLQAYIFVGHVCETQQTRQFFKCHSLIFREKL